MSQSWRTLMEYRATRSRWARIVSRAQRIFSWSEIRWKLRAPLRFYRRGRYGWDYSDTWSLDMYLARVIAPALRHMAAVGHGVPGPFMARTVGFDAETGEGGDVAVAADLWHAWLLDKAAWFEWYERDMDLPPEESWSTPGIGDAEVRRRIDAFNAKKDHFFQEVLPDFGAHFGSLWD